MSAVAIEPAGSGLRSARPVDLRRAARVGVVAGIGAVFVASIGMVEDFQTRSVVGELSLGYVFLFAFPLMAGYLGATPPPAIEGYAPPAPGARNIAAGALAGAGVALVLGVYLAIVGNIDVRSIFLNITASLVDLLTLGRGLRSGTALLAAWCVGLGVFGGALHLAPARLRHLLVVAVVWVLAFALLQTVVETTTRQLGLSAVARFLYETGGSLALFGGVVIAAVGIAVDQLVLPRRAAAGRRVAAMPTSGQRNVRLALGALGLLLLGALPHVLGQFLTAVANLAGIYMLLALGLNIVVGFAGLLNLGHVAFLTVGAYVTGVLAAPGSGPGLPIVAVLPIAIVAGAIAGLVVGAPVLRAVMTGFTSSTSPRRSSVRSTNVPLCVRNEGAPRSAGVHVCSWPECMTRRTTCTPHCCTAVCW